jgi:DNA-directed RNA polymerase specialized sigma24 family protein
VNENNKRLDKLHRQHYPWLYSVAFKVSKSKEVSEDLIQELYLYLSERQDSRLWFDDTFNLQYCRSFILSRFYNLVKYEDRFSALPEEWDEEHIPYDYEGDNRLEDSYQQLKRELEQLKKSPKWSSALLFELYWFDNKTYDEVSRDIKISKSTAFLNVRKVKHYLRDNVENPFTSSKN